MEGGGSIWGKESIFIESADLVKVGETWTGSNRWTQFEAGARCPAALSHSQLLTLGSLCPFLAPFSQP